MSGEATVKAPTGQLNGTMTRRPSGKEAAEAERERLVARRMMKLALWIWPSFFVLDIYMAVLLFPQMPLAKALIMRLVQQVALFIVYRLTFVARVPSRVITLMAMGMFVLASTLISVLCIDFGGMRSAYIHGISIVMLVGSVLMARPWKPALGFMMMNALSFPVVLGIGAIFSVSVRKQWTDIWLIEEFFSHYIAVLSSAIVGAVASHMVWASQQQVFQARKLGRYRLEAQIGEGGMGEVWLAGDEVLKRKVALKILREKGAPDAAAVRTFEREARAASMLSHPNTIRIFDFGASDDGIYYIAMEHLTGADLDRLVTDHGPMPVGRALRFVEQACRSLTEAHEAGLIHRDIKPQNLFAARSGDDMEMVKLLDFGLAREALTSGEDAQMTRTGVIKGTPTYMAPEIWAGADADALSDLYAMGATLYFLLAGVPPFDGTTARDILKAHLSQIPVPPSERRRGPLPPGLDEIVLKCLAKDPRERFASARELATALTPYLKDAPWTREDTRRFWLVERAARLAEGAQPARKTSGLDSTQIAP